MNNYLTSLCNDLKDGTEKEYLSVYLGFWTIPIYAKGCPFAIMHNLFYIIRRIERIKGC